MLGGGHGFLQGQYDLMADNLLSACLVLANGSVVTASENSYPDLFWGVRGAGHNFGVVTEYEYKIYDVPPDDRWAYSMLVFTGDKVEELYEQINQMTEDENTVAELINFSFFIWDADIDREKPVIIFFLLYNGDSSIEQEYSAQFQAIGPAVAKTGVTTYPELPALTANGNDDPACQRGASVLRFPISMNSYDTRAQRAVYDIFTEITTETPEFNGSFSLFEGYSVKAVRGIPDESTAFAHRQDSLLISPVIIYTPNSTLDATAIRSGKELRRILHDADGNPELHAYVNYAHGDETLEEVYGFGQGRVERLRALKREYDPNGRFSYYEPVG